MKTYDQKQSQQQPQQPAQASSKAMNRISMKRKTRISSESATLYNISKDASDKRASEDRLIADALAILDGRITRGEALTDPMQAANYCKVRLQHLEHEVFLVLFLDTRHRVIAAEEMFRGTIDGSEVHAREVAKRALHHNASAVIYAHNHPSGNQEPSAADRAVTARLKQALALIDIRSLDHFIIGDGAPTSLAQRGLM